MMLKMYIDLEEESRKGTFLSAEAFKKANLPPCSISAIGGIPISEEEWAPDQHRLRIMCFAALGEGSLLTFGNPKRRSRQEYGDKALKEKHLWALRTFYLTFFFADAPEAFRLDVAYSRKFHMSWQEKTAPGMPIVFTAQGSLREWSKFLSHHEDTSFGASTREWMKHTRDVIAKFFPEINV